MSSMMTPLSVQFTLEQRDWLDARTRGGVLSRSSVIRLIVAEAMEREQLASKPRQRQGSMASAEAAAAPAQACIDRGAAEQFLSLLGKDPASARLRAFPTAPTPRREQSAPARAPSIWRWRSSGSGKAGASTW